MCGWSKATKEQIGKWLDQRGVRSVLCWQWLVMSLIKISMGRHWRNLGQDMIWFIKKKKKKILDLQTCEIRRDAILFKFRWARKSIDFLEVLEAPVNLCVCVLMKVSQPVLATQDLWAYNINSYTYTWVIWI